MGFRDRIDAARAAQHEQATAAESEAAEREAAWQRRVEQHRSRAQALLPEVDEALALLRSNRQRSFQLLDGSRGDVRIAWGDKDGRLSDPPGPGSSRKAARRWKRRRALGWTVQTSRRSGPIGRADSGHPAGPVVIPLQGPPRIGDLKTAETLEEHVQQALQQYTSHNKEDGTTVREVHADKTLLALLDRLADHLADLDT